jgi:hypothetical protein
MNLTNSVNKYIDETFDKTAGENFEVELLKAAADFLVENEQEVNEENLTNAVIEIETALEEQEKLASEEVEEVEEESEFDEEIAKIAQEAYDLGRAEAEEEAEFAKIANEILDESGDEAYQDFLVKMAVELHEETEADYTDEDLIETMTNLDKIAMKGMGNILDTAKAGFKKAKAYGKLGMKKVKGVAEEVYTNPKTSKALEAGKKYSIPAVSLAGGMAIGQAVKSKKDK